MASRPNILVFMTDQQHVSTLAPESPVRTPHFDALVGRGTRFANAFCPTPICVPSRASVQTGLLPHRHRLVHNTHRNYHLLPDLPADLPTLGSLLTNAGYRATYVGKWHVGRTRTPVDLGYREFLEPRAAHPVPEAAAWTDVVRIPGEGKRSIISASVPMAAADSEPLVVARAAADVIRGHGGHSEESLFLFVSTTAPHVPWLCPAEYANLHDPATIPVPASYGDSLSDLPLAYQRHFNYHNDCRMPDRWPDVARAISHYYGLCSLLDDALGAVVAALTAADMLGSTWIIVTSDHGEMMGAHGMIGKGEYLLDDLIRVPLAIIPPAAPSFPKWPDRLGPARGSGPLPPPSAAGAATTRPAAAEFVTLTDLFATCLAVAGVPPPTGSDSRSLLPLLQAPAASGSFPDEVFVEHHGSMFFNTIRGIRTREFKYVFRAHETDELYDLRNDPDERVNRIADPEYAEVLADLRRRLVAWMKRTDDMAAAGAEAVLLASR